MFFGFNAVQCMNNPKYQNFRLEDPFRIEYTLVPNLMVSWKTPIRVTSVIIWFIFFYNIISICTYHFFQIFFSFSAKIVELMLMVHIQKNCFFLYYRKRIKNSGPILLPELNERYNILIFIIGDKTNLPKVIFLIYFLNKNFFSSKWHLL